MPSKKIKNRKVDEQHNYTVKTTKDVAGAPQETEKTINAPNAQQAITKAMQGDPEQGRYDSVEVTKGDGASKGPRTEPQTQSKTSAATQGMAGLESVEFPYHVGLPLTYIPLIESFTKKLKEGLEIETRYGRVHIVVPNAKVMETMITELGRRSRGRTKVKELAGVVSRGITESIEGVTRKPLHRREIPGSRKAAGIKVTD